MLNCRCFAIQAEAQPEMAITTEWPGRKLQPKNKTLLLDATIQYVKTYDQLTGNDS
jgi:hypothetical protein